MFGLYFFNFCSAAVLGFVGALWLLLGPVFSVFLVGFFTLSSLILLVFECSEGKGKKQVFVRRWSVALRFADKRSSMVQCLWSSDFYATHRNITVHSHCLFPRTLTLYSAMCIKAFALFSDVCNSLLLPPAFSGLPFSWWSEDTHRLLPALAGSSREFQEWARWAASNFQLTVGRVGRRTRALTALLKG